VSRPILVVRDLEKSYRELSVLRGVSLSAGAGEVVGIVGPNGAGKTTLIECVEGIRVPDAGSVEILGRRPADGPWVYNALFGAQLQESSLPARIRVGEALHLFASMQTDPYDVTRMLERMGLTADRRRFFTNLSGGQKRRTLLAVALIGRPPLVLLDEPTAGLDPHARLAMWSLLGDCTRDGTTVVFTTHDMAEAEEYSDRVHLLDRGEMIAAGRPADLLLQAGLGSRLRAPGREGLADWLRAVPGHAAVRVIEGMVYGFGDADYSRRVLRLLEQARVGEGGLSPDVAHDVLDRLTVGPARMEDLYLMSTGAVYDSAN